MDPRDDAQPREILRGLERAWLRAVSLADSAQEASGEKETVHDDSVCVSLILTNGKLESKCSYFSRGLASHYMKTRNDTVVYKSAVESRAGD